MLLVSFFLSLLLSCSAQSPGDLRLWRNGISSSSYSYGRLRVFVGGKWSEICEDGFGQNEADVACHQLQFINAVSIEGSGESASDESDLGDIGLSEVYCPTSDYLHLLRCSFQLGQHSCSGRGFTMLECNSTRIWDRPYIGQIRLQGGQYTSLGLAQIYCDRGWGVICADYSFEQTEADTVCRQLGYTGAVDYNHLSSLRSSNLPYLMSDVDCPSSNEQCLGACRQCSERVTDYCSSYDRLTIECRFDTLHYTFGSNVSTCEYEEGGFLASRPRVGEVRFSTTTITSSLSDQNDSGLAQIFYNSTDDAEPTWTGLCVGSFDDKYLADTFCTQMGYTMAVKYISVSAPVNASRLSVHCLERVPHLLRCHVTSANATTCPSLLMVTCGTSYSDIYTGQLRLRGGDYPSEGRVEIYVYGVWSSIYYYYNYDDNTIDSICRQLGYTEAAHYAIGEIRGNGTVRVASPNCDGVRTCFSNCLYDYDFSSRSSHSYDLSVNCSFNFSLRFSVRHGSKSQCEIEEPGDDNGGGNYGWVAAVIIPIVLLCGIFVTITVIIVCVTKSSKKKTRKARQRQFSSGAVAYNPRAPGGGGVLMVPVNQIPPQGLVLVPPQHPNAVPPMAAPSSAAEEKEEEKVVPPSNDEVAPSS